VTAKVPVMQARIHRCSQRAGAVVCAHHGCRADTNHHPAVPHSGCHRACCHHRRQVQPGRTGSNGDIAGSPGGQQRGSPHKDRPAEKPQAVAGPLLLAAAELIRQFPEVCCRLPGWRSFLGFCAEQHSGETVSEIRLVLPVLVCALISTQTSGALHARIWDTVSRRSQVPSAVMPHEHAETTAPHRLPSTPRSSRTWWSAWRARWTPRSGRRCSRRSAAPR